MKIWARVGMSLIVDEEKFAENPKQAILQAITDGDAMLDGETYIPDEDGDEVVSMELGLVRISGTESADSL